MLYETGDHHSWPIALQLLWLIWHSSEKTAYKEVEQYCVSRRSPWCPWRCSTPPCRCCLTACNPSYPASAPCATALPCATAHWQLLLLSLLLLLQQQRLWWHSRQKNVAGALYSHRNVTQMRRNTAPERSCCTWARLKNPGFLKKAQPSGFFGFFLHFWTSRKK